MARVRKIEGKHEPTRSPLGMEDWTFDMFVMKRKCDAYERDFRALVTLARRGDMNARAILNDRFSFRFIQTLTLLIALLLPALTFGASAVLTWQDNSDNEQGFNVQRKVEACAGTGTFTQLAQVGVNVTTLTDPVQEGNSYCYRVNAYNSAGASAWSNSAGAGVPYTGASSPTGLTMTAGTLTWTDKTSNETGFLIQRKVAACAVTGPFVDLATVGANVVTYKDTGASQGNTYCYRVAATNALGNSPYSNTAEYAVPLVTPAAPANLGITVQP